MRVLFAACRIFLVPALFLTFILCDSAIAQAVPQQDTPQAAVTYRRPLITEVIDESHLTRLTGNTHPLARPEYDLGAAPATLPMQRMLLVLKRSPEQEAALARLLDDQQDKNSPNYHKWLSPEEFGKQFGPSDEDMQTIALWLQSHGFEVGTTKGRSVLEFSGSASQVQEAFHTTIHKYIANGEQHWANAEDPSIPAALAPAVAGIDSLNDFSRKAMSTFLGTYSEETKQLTSTEPNYTFACGGGRTCYGVVPYDFAAIYDVLPLWNAGINGAGQTIAIVGRTNIHQSDPTTFWSLFGLTVPPNKLTVTLNGPDPGIVEDEGEADLDIEWSGAVAPQALINFVTSQSTSTTDGVDLSALYIVENNLASVISESYGECELGLGTAGNQFYSTVWSQAAAQGISVFVSSGDNGSAGCDYPGGPAQYGLNVNGIASTPFNAAVGGTDFNQYKKQSTYWNSTNAAGTYQSAKGYIPETTWNDSCTNALAVTLGFGSNAEQACNNPQMLQQGGVISVAGSGGPSNCVVNTQAVLGSCTKGYAKPSWQTGSGTQTDHLRDLPDISLFASNGFMGSFYVVCTGGTCGLNNFAGYGGTSVSSPAFAGIMALVNQKMAAPQGVPGFALYKLASKQPNAFHDIPSGSTIAVPCITGTPNCRTNVTTDYYGISTGYSTGTGYDLATGLGSVDVANLVNNWNKAAFTATTSTLTLGDGTNAVNVTHGTAVPVDIAISPTAAGGNAALLVDVGPGTTTGKAIDVFPVSAGSVSGTTSVLPAGSYNVIAHYGGDGTYGGSYSNSVSVTVSPENSSVILGGVILNGTTTPVTTFPFDSQYFVRADVGNSTGSLCSPPPFGEVACPTGGVVFTEDGQQTNFNTFSLNSEGFTETWLGALGGLTGGTHVLAAQYSGDNNYNPSSGSVVLTVTKAATETVQVNAQGSITQPITLSTAVEDPHAYSSLTTTPTGTVTFYSNGNAIPGTPTYSMGSNGVFLYTTASLSTSFPTPGTYTLSASYSGDQNYQPSTSSAHPVTLKYPRPTISAGPYSQTILPGTAVTVTALVDTTNTLQVPTGTVSLTNSNIILPGPTACTQTTDSNGNYACQATFTFTPPPPSVSTNDFFSIQYSGDANYPASQSGSYSINISDFWISPDTTQVAVAQGSSQSANISVFPLNGFSGSVGFSCSGLPAEATCSFNPGTVTGGSGSTQLTITTAPIGQERLMRRARSERPKMRWTAAMITPLVGLCLIGIPAVRRRRVAALLMIAALITMLPSCGGGGSSTPPPQNNPVPSIASLAPNQQVAGSQSQRLSITGSNFVRGSTVTYNGMAHAPSFFSPSQLGIILSQGDMASPGSNAVIVTNPAPGGGASNSATFNVVSAGTPVGTFAVTVTAASGSESHSTTVTLIVQ